MIAAAGAPRRRYLVPEVIQASAMDCGPATLTSLLAGFDIPANYAALRQACQTDVDGTSIDRIEELASELGLVAEQVMVPSDHVLRPEAALLPALLVVLLPGGFTHFVVAWRRIGPFVQVMDPGSGRQVVSAAALGERMYSHEHAVRAEDWLEWAASEDFQAPLRGRLRDIGADASATADFLAAARGGSRWQDLAALDAAVRFVTALMGSGDVRHGAEAGQTIAALARGARDRPDMIPDRHWSAREGSDGALWIRGALLVRIKGRKREAATSGAPSLAAAVLPGRPGMLAKLAPLARTIPPRVRNVLAAAALVAAGAAAVEALLLNALLHSGLVPMTSYARAALVLGVCGYGLFVLALDVISVRAALAAGRRLEAEFRIALLAKLPRIADRHLRTWLRSDLAHRAHSIAVLRDLPLIVSQGLRIAGEVVITAAALVIFYEGAAVPALLGAVVAIAIPLAAFPFLADKHVRLHALEGALSLNYLDALVGGVAARAHAAEGVLRREHADKLDDWEEAGRRLQAALVASGAIQQAAALVFTGLVIVPHITRHGAGAGTLLLVFWALRLPALGGAMASILEQGLSMRSTIVRLLEPMDAPEEIAEGAAEGGGPLTRCEVTLDNVSVLAGGHPILTGVDLTIADGEHVAVLGASGSGKSTLLGLLLGWHSPADGQRLLNGVPLEGAVLDELRARTAWLEPGVRLWNTTVSANVLYGSDPSLVAAAMQDVRLQAIVDSLPAGSETGLGEEGGLLSGGEGQKVRTARAFARGKPALVILDEPFRGLGRGERSRLLDQARRRWHDATLLCATHDLPDTLAFDRVVILDDGRVVESGSPAALAAAPGSRYSAMLDAYDGLEQGSWGTSSWRRLAIGEGRVRAAAE